MALLEWNDTLSVSVGEIDGQHQKLVETINELHDAMRQRKSREVMGDILSALVDYTATHFKTEEDYFIEFGYPDADKHKQEHADFVEKALEFKSGFEAGKLGVSIEVMSFLSDWIRNHIKGSDKLYTPIFNNNGLS